MTFLRRYRTFLSALLTGVGMAGLSYGMLRDDDVTFVVGLVLFVSGYLVFRQQLKERGRNRS